MWLIRLALRRPVSVLVAVLSLALTSALAITRMPVDLFPNLGAPAIFVAQPYGGLDPQQMEAFATYYYEYHFLYITGIEHVESKSIQRIAHEAGVPPWDGHEPGDGADGGLRQPRACPHAARRRAPVRPAL
jgi:hypothetical protein